MHAPTIIVTVLLFLTLDHIRNGSRLQSPVPGLSRRHRPRPARLSRVASIVREDLSRSINKIVYGNLGAGALLKEACQGAATLKRIESSPAPDAKAPAIVLLGAKKAGTSSLFRYLLANDGATACVQRDRLLVHAAARARNDRRKQGRKRADSARVGGFFLCCRETVLTASPSRRPPDTCTRARPLRSWVRLFRQVGRQRREGPQKFVALLRSRQIDSHQTTTRDPARRRVGNGSRRGSRRSGSA